MFSERGTALLHRPARRHQAGRVAPARSDGPALVGTGVEDGRGRGRTSPRYRRVADEGVAIYHHNTLQEQANDYTAIDRLMLPMGTSDARVELILSIVVRIRGTLKQSPHSARVVCRCHCIEHDACSRPTG
jgi:hypothetical protein